MGGRTVKYPCPIAYTPDCNGSQCSQWGKPNCVDGYITMAIGVAGGRTVKYPCPRAYTPDCNGSKCSQWGKPNCVDGYIQVPIKL